MPKKLTIEEMKIVAKQLGTWVILDDNEHVNQSTRLNCKCLNCGYQHRVRWVYIQRGNGCPSCNVTSKKLTIEEVKGRSSEIGIWEVLSDVYVDAHTKLICRCVKEGHFHRITWANIQPNKGCAYCSKRAKPKLEFIKLDFEKNGWVLSSIKYKNSSTKLDCICPNGHKCKISWSCWQQGIRCPICSIAGRSGERHYNWQGGISADPYCFVWGDKEFKEFIKQRDGHRCMNPCCSGCSERLCVHHIDYNKKSCGPENLITLCRSCNSIANKDRGWHIVWYQAIMYMRYGYVY